MGEPYGLPIVTEAGRRVAKKSLHDAEVNRKFTETETLQAYTLGTIQERTAEIANLPLLQIGSRFLQVEEVSFDLRVLRGYWADNGLPWVPGGLLDDLFTVTEIGNLTVTEWSFDLRAMRGYITATGEPWPEISSGGSASMPRMQVHVVSSILLHIYVRQAGSAYVRWEMRRDIVPSRNADVWHIGASTHVNRVAGAYVPVSEITFNGETDVAIWFRQSVGGPNKPDHIGGSLHGNEELTVATLLVNGAKLDTSIVKLYDCETFEVIMTSRMFLPGNTEATVWSPKGQHVMTHFKHLSIGPDGWWNQQSRINHIVGGFQVENGYFGMLCLGWGTSRGYYSVHTAAREPLWALEDVSIPNFPEVGSTSTYLKAWGDAYGGEVEIFKGWSSSGRNIRVDNRDDRRKIYSDFFEGDITATGTPWNISMRYRVTVKDNS